jgi:hypothetical protein
MKGVPIHNMKGSFGSGKYHKNLDVPEPLISYRVCLRCDRCFPSTGPDHRICDVHKQAAGVWSAGMTGIAEGWEHIG